MSDYLTSLFSKDTSELSGGETAGIIISVFLAIGIFAFFIRTCFRLERISGKPAFTAVKVIMIAAPPTIFSVLTLLDIDVLFKWFGLATVIMCIATAVWNILTYGILGGLMFTVVHIVFGLIAGLGIVALIFIAIAGVVLFFFAGSSSSGGASSGSSAPEYVINTATGETVYVEKGANGELYIMGTSNVLRSSDYSGRYFDDYGNQYISC